MNKVRFFALITFSDTNLLIDYLSLISKKIGKYDFFSQNIKYPCDLSGNYSSNSNFKIKVISFNKLYLIEKSKFFSKKAEEVKEKMSITGHVNFNMSYGYLNKHQVVTLHRTPSPDRIYISKELHAQVQLVFANGRMSLLDTDNKEFSIIDVKKYFEDLHSLYREEISK
ncbi:MAG: DUF4416 family protein [Spirochaetia bacterium]|nr:DUF4416 family protein [Spirochaetia bacterium]